VESQTGISKDTCELHEINAARLIDYREIDQLLREILAMKMARWI
jgi:hypothetical protein